MHNNKHCTIVLLLGFLLVCGSFSGGLQSFGVKTVVIDAGHGGKDPGCSGVTFKEKDVALAVALKLGKYIEKNCLDVRVIYTRTTDVFVELQERAAIANRNKADLFICIHCNANPKKDAHGSETYVMGINKTRGNLDVAKRENASILMEDNYKKNYEGFDPNSDEANIIWSTLQNKHLEQALNLSAKIQSQYKDKAGRIDKGIKQAGFLVLWRTTMASLLTETGFLTNPEEEKFLGSETGQEELAMAIFNAFRDYKDGIEGHRTKVPEDQAINAALPAPKDSSKGDSKDTSKDTSTVVFSVQLISSEKKIPLHSERFNGIENISELLDRGMYKYLCGPFSTLEASIRQQTQVRKQGFPDAFTVAFKEGKRISIDQAKKLLK